MFLHRTRARSVEPNPSWALLSRVLDACSLAFKTGGAEKASGHSFDSRFSINVEYSEVPSLDLNAQLVLSTQGEWSEVLSGLMART